MDARQFDRIAKTLGSGADRRRVLGALAGSVAAVLGKQQLTPAQADSDCAHFCEEAFPPGRERGQCVREAAHGGGTCQECAGDVARFCGGACVDLTADQDHCGQCDHPCTGTETCFEGSCCTPPTWEQACPRCTCDTIQTACGPVDCGALKCRTPAGQLVCFDNGQACCVDPASCPGDPNCGTCIADASC
jgi:hypothetical protein